MKILGGNKRRVSEEKVEERPARRLRSQDKSSEQFRVGRVMAGDAKSHRREIELERMDERKQLKKRNVAVLSVAAIFVFVVIFVAFGIFTKIESDKQGDEITESLDFPTEPHVAIIDENAGGLISSRTKTFIARLESDAGDYGFSLDHVVLPFQKSREVFVYVSGRNEYYKVTTDRGSTVQAEDIARMIRYLDGKGLAPEYVDIRVEGKAFYK